MQLKCHANRQIVNYRIAFEKHFEITDPFWMGAIYCDNVVKYIT
jgi:hypothetical protein